MTYGSDNWSNLIDEYDSLIGEKYLDDDGNEHIFIGLLHGQDDYYFVMWREGKVKLLTCVGIPEQMGFRLRPDQESKTKNYLSAVTSSEN